MAIKLLITDGHPIVRAGIKKMLTGTGIKVVADVSTGSDAIQSVRKREPDVVLMDFRLPDDTELGTLGRIRLNQPELPLLLYTGHDNPVWIARAVAWGASGCLSKTCTPKELIAAIKAVAQGETLWTRTELRQLSGALATPRLGVQWEFSLSHREMQVVRQIIRGMTNQQIGNELEISYETVKEHVQHILRKLGLNDRTQLAVWALRNGLVE